MGSKEKSEGQISHDPNKLLVRQQGILPDGVSSKQVRSDADLFEMERTESGNCAPPSRACSLLILPDLVLSRVCRREDHSLPFGRIEPGVEVEYSIHLLVNVFI